MGVCIYRYRRGFSLIELVIVVVILGLISAMAIPRMTRGAGNAGAATLRGDLAVLRGAIELYRAEHEGRFPVAMAIADQLTKFTKHDGTDPQTTADVASGRIYGPYLAKVPPLPVGAQKGKTSIETADGPTVGWIYIPASGLIVANCAGTELDPDGVAYNTY